MDSLCDEVFCQLLNFLDVNCLLKCRLVCKRWNNVIKGEIARITHLRVNFRQAAYPYPLTKLLFYEEQREVICNEDSFEECINFIANNCSKLISLSIPNCQPTWETLVDIQSKLSVLEICGLQNAKDFVRLNRYFGYMSGISSIYQKEHSILPKIHTSPLPTHKPFNHVRWLYLQNDLNYENKSKFYGGLPVLENVEVLYLIDDINDMSNQFFQFKYPNLIHLYYAVADWENTTLTIKYNRRRRYLLNSLRNSPKLQSAEFTFEEFVGFSELLDLFAEEIDKIKYVRINHTGQKNGVVPLRLGPVQKYLNLRLPNHRLIWNNLTSNQLTTLAIESKFIYEVSFYLPNLEKFSLTCKSDASPDLVELLDSLGRSKNLRKLNFILSSFPVNCIDLLATYINSTKTLSEINIEHHDEYSWPEEKETTFNFFSHRNFRKFSWIAGGKNGTLARTTRKMHFTFNIDIFNTVEIDLTSNSIAMCPLEDHLMLNFQGLNIKSFNLIEENFSKITTCDLKKKISLRINEMSSIVTKKKHPHNFMMGFEFVKARQEKEEKILKIRGQFDREVFDNLMNSIQGKYRLHQEIITSLPPIFISNQ